jgi:hypothetical protein
MINVIAEYRRIMPGRIVMMIALTEYRGRTVEENFR